MSIPSIPDGYTTFPNILFNLFWHFAEWRPPKTVLWQPPEIDSDDMAQTFAALESWTKDASTKSTVRNFLGAALASNTIRAVGISVANGDLVYLPASSWRLMSRFISPPRSAIECAFAGANVDIPGTQMRRFPHFPILSLRALADAIGAEAPPPSPTLLPLESIEALSPTLTVQAPPTTAPPAVFVQTPVPASPKGGAGYSEAALGAWFVLRERTWKMSEAYPTEADDFAAAKGTFGSIPRDRFREIRRSKTPESWRKPGPRKSRG